MFEFIASLVDKSKPVLIRTLIIYMWIYRVGKLNLNFFSTNVHIYPHCQKSKKNALQIT